MAFRALTLTFVLAALAPGAASASGLVDRNAAKARLAVRGNGTALVTYRAAGRTRHVLAFGAINALHPGAAPRQVRFRLDYSGGGKKHVWKTFGTTCLRYDGPALPWLVKACRAPDGSYWALQSWQPALPHRGYPPWQSPQTAWDLRLSHWRGPIAKLEVWTDWAFGGRAHDLFGRLTYVGVPVHGFRTTPAGVPDSFGRSLYIDTFDSAYGQGWKRETSVVFRRPTGAFCYSFWPTNDRSLPGAPRRPVGNGKRYRITVQGPGVTPDVMWDGPGLHDYNPRNPADVAYERQQNAIFDQVVAGDKFCPSQR
ncbi:MAG: hypothetical protein M3540_03880 [Actinomycetota bacterium]|nr:hypothetical protein [Actinomycetota bacterium]